MNKDEAIREIADCLETVFDGNVLWVSRIGVEPATYSSTAKLAFDRLHKIFTPISKPDYPKITPISKPLQEIEALSEIDDMLTALDADQTERVLQYFVHKHR